MASLQTLLSKAKNGIAITPGVYSISTPLVIPKPAEGIFEFSPMPGAIFQVEANAALFDLSNLPEGTGLAIPCLFVELDEGASFAAFNSSRAYIDMLLCARKSNAPTPEEFLGSALYGRVMQGVIE